VPRKRTFLTIADLEAVQGSGVGESDWFTVTQELIDEFVRVTEDRQWIHVDRERAARESPYGTTIAPGLLTLSLIPQLLGQCVSFPTARMNLNYGFDRLRFISAVPAGGRIRAKFAIADVRRQDDAARVMWRVGVAVQGREKLAISANWITLSVFPAESSTAPATASEPKAS